MASARIEPTVFLKLNPKEVITKYLNGEYLQRGISFPIVSSSSVSSPTPSSSSLPSTFSLHEHFAKNITKYSKDENSERYILSTREGAPRVYVTVNHNIYTQNFTSVPENVLNYKKPVEIEYKTCHYCRRQFNGDHVSIPVKMLISGKTIQFQCTGIFHSFGCAYAQLGNETKIINGEGLYINSEQYLRYLFHLFHPGKELIKSKDWKLLEINGGPLSFEEYDTEQYFYQSTPNIICFMIKTEYLRCSGPGYSQVN
jgi:hypothetical protein